MKIWHLKKGSGPNESGARLERVRPEGDVSGRQRRRTEQPLPGRRAIALVRVPDVVVPFSLALHWVPKLDKISNWGLEIRDNSICVNNALNYQTNVPGIFAIGDINTYPGKLKLILCGFHEATLMCQAAFKIIHPHKKNILRYTTVTGIKGFDGSKRKSESATIKSIE